MLTVVCATWTALGPRVSPSHLLYIPQLGFHYGCCSRALRAIGSVGGPISGISLDVASSHATRFFGMLGGGVFLTFFDNSTLFLILAAIYLIACAIIIRVQDNAIHSPKKLTLNEEIYLVIQQAKRLGTQLTHCTQEGL